MVGALSQNCSKMHLILFCYAHWSVLASFPGVEGEEKGNEAMVRLYCPCHIEQSREVASVNY